MTDPSRNNDPYRDDHPENFTNPEPTGDYGAPNSYPTGDYASGQPTPGSYGDYGNYGSTGYPQDGYPEGGYPQAGYPVGGYPSGGTYPGEINEKNNVALWAMILGIVGILLVITIVIFPLGTLLGIAALVLGIMGLRRANKMVGPQRRKGMAITGIVLGILSLLATLGIILVGFAGVQLLQDTGAIECSVYLEGDNPDQAAFNQCVEDALNSGTQN